METNTVSVREKSPRQPASMCAFLEAARVGVPYELMMENDPENPRGLLESKVSETALKVRSQGAGSWG